MKGYWFASQSFYYGLSEHITLSAQIGWFQSNLFTHSINQDVITDVNSSAHGLSDADIRATWQVLERSKFSMALMGGVELPTGAQNVEINGISSAVGSGSYDPIGGIILQEKNGRHSFRLYSQYKLTTTNKDDKNFGDFWASDLTYDITLGKMACIAPDSASKKVMTKYDLFGGVSHEWMQTESENGYTVANSGGTRLFGMAGVRLSLNERFFIPVSLELPLYENLKGVQNKSSWRIRAGVSILLKK